LTSSKYSRKHAWKVDFVVLSGGFNPKVRLEQVLGINGYCNSVSCGKNHIFPYETPQNKKID
jgi:hypothetical protein